MPEVPVIFLFVIRDQSRPQVYPGDPQCSGSSQQILGFVVCFFFSEANMFKETTIYRGHSLVILFGFWCPWGKYCKGWTPGICPGYSLFVLSDTKLYWVIHVIIIFSRCSQFPPNNHRHLPLFESLVVVLTAVWWSWVTVIVMGFLYDLRAYG